MILLVLLSLGSFCSRALAAMKQSGLSIQLSDRSAQSHFALRHSSLQHESFAEMRMRRWSAWSCEIEVLVELGRTKTKKAHAGFDGAPGRNVSLIVESELSKPLSTLNRWGLQSCELKRNHLAREKVETTITWQDTTFLDTPTSNAPVDVFVKWCREHSLSPLLLLCCLVVVCPATMVAVTMYMKREGSRRSQADMPGVEFGDGSWAQAYRRSGGTRREALRLLIQCRVITPCELANDATIVDPAYMEESISVAEDMLRIQPRVVWLDDPKATRSTFEAHLAQQTSDGGLSVVDEECSMFSPEEKSEKASFQKTPPRISLTPRQGWAASPGLPVDARKAGLGISPGTPMSDSLLSESPLVDCGYPCPPSPSPSL